VLPTQRYDLSFDQVRRDVSDFLTRVDLLPGRFVVVVVGPDHQLSAAARSVERVAFEEKFGNDAKAMQVEYGDYESASRFIVVLDRGEQLPAGVLRFIEDGGAGLKALNDAPAHIGGTVAQIRAYHGIGGDEVARDIGTLAVLPQYRGSRSAFMVSSLLYRAVYLVFHQQGVKHVVAMIDGGAYRNLKTIGVPFVPMFGSAPFEYLGATDNRALYGDFHQLIPAMSEKAAELRQQARLGLRDVCRPNLKRLVFRRVAAKIATSIATGDNLDPHIVLP
jgi:hypothetical protein